MDKSRTLLAPHSVRINRLARFFCDPDWSWEVQGRSDWTQEGNPPVGFNFDLWTVLQGRGTLETPAGTYTLGAGDCFILRGDEHYLGRHEPSDPLVVFAVHYDYLDAQGRLLRPAATRLHRRIRQLEFFSGLLDRMEAAWLEDRRRLSLAHQWLAACLAEVEQQDRLGVVHGRSRQVAEAIEKICREVARDPRKAYPAAELARRLFCTPNHFCRLFKAVKGMTPRDFIANARIEHAKGLLHSSDYPVKRIAELCGFCDTYFFSRQFRKKTGVCPSVYRQERWNEG